jgi:hypothetical protein
MSPDSSPFSSRRGGWRPWVASYALAALVWPALGSLPWLDLDLAPLDAGHALHEHRDASEIPGSPTHPADHDCFQCQVLKHLSRCVLALPAAPVVAALSGTPVAPPFRAVAQHAPRVAALPPARGPPLHLS